MTPPDGARDPATKRGRASNKPRSTVMLRVIKGGFVPADRVSEAKLHTRPYKVGQVLSAELRIPRDGTQWSKAHVLGEFLIQNTDEFAHYTDAHAVLKRLQLEGDIECDAIAIRSDYGLLEHRVPRSLAFELMDQITFDRVYAAFCRWIEKKYMPGIDHGVLLDLEKLMGMAG